MLLTEHCQAFNSAYTLEQLWAKWVCDRLTEDGDFGKKKIIFSDEAHFDLGWYVNNKIENLHAYIEKPMRPKRVTVWCGFWSRGIIEPFFFENEQGEVVTVNGDRCRAMLNEFLITRGGYWQDLVSTGRRYVPHSRSYTQCFAPCFWRSHYKPQSCDLTPLAYYLWVAVKDKCYADKPETIDILKDCIREAIGEIQLHTIDNVLKNWTESVSYCMASGGSHLNEIIFRY